MKKIILLLLMSVVVFSCSKDEDNIIDPTTPKPIVPSTTGAITDKGINFSHQDLKITSISIDRAKQTKTASNIIYTIMSIQFNDNFEVLIYAPFDLEQGGIKPTRALEETLSRANKIQVYFTEENKQPIIMTSDKLEYLSLVDSKLKFNYKDTDYILMGEVETPTDILINVPEIIEDNDGGEVENPDNPDIQTMKEKILHTRWKGSSRDIFKGTFIEAMFDYKDFSLTFYEDKVVYDLANLGGTTIKPKIKYTEKGFEISDVITTDREDTEFTITYEVLNYTENTMTIRYVERKDRWGITELKIDIPMTRMEANIVPL